MTNPAVAKRMLITYAICIPVAALMGFLLTNPLDYGTLGFIGLVLLLLVSPILIKWHYPLMVFALGCPMVCFFLVGRPPLGQVMVLLSLGLAIVERTTNSEKRFISVPVMIWPLVFIFGVVVMTAKLTGGIGFHSLGGDTGGGQKYLAVFVGIATYFALSSQKIPRARWKFYLGLYVLSGLAGVFSDLFPVLPSPLNLINLLFPPSISLDKDMVLGTSRLGALSGAFGIVPTYLLARYGLRGIFGTSRLWRPVLFLVCVALTMLGGFRSVVSWYALLIILMLFLEGLHRTRVAALLVIIGLMGAMLLGVFSDRLPFTFQRALCFLPFNWQTEAVMDAQASSDWRHGIWRAMWPKVPGYLLLGKGFALNAEDYQNIGTGAFANIRASHLDASEEALAISSDFHSGPLSTLIPFGLWGAIGMIWLMAATIFCLYRNYKYGGAELQVFNAYLLACGLALMFNFFFIFGAVPNDVNGLARLAGLSVAMNWGVARRPVQPSVNPLIKPRPLPTPQPA